jgi:hypothetical protein
LVKNSPRDSENLWTHRVGLALGPVIIDVSVDDHEVLPTIAIEVQALRTKTKRFLFGVDQSVATRGIGKKTRRVL